MNQNSYYYYDGKRVELAPSATHMAVRFPATPTMEARSTFSAAFNGAGLSRGTDLGDGLFLFERPPSAGPAAAVAAIAVAAANVGGKDLEVFDGPGLTPMVVTEDFIAQFKPTMSRSAIDAINTKENVSIVRELQWLPNTFVLRSNDPKARALDLANSYQESGQAVYAHPDFVRVMKPALIPNDTLFPQQWALRNVGQGGGVAGQDIHASEAWDITRGSAAVTIAIIDEGVDYTHPDLNVAGKLVTGYDAVTGTNNPAPAGNDAHGTACAGIAAAGGSNAEGISGVAPGCRIMGVRIANGIPGGWNTRDAWLADGITTAAARGADVLSNSWGGGSPSTLITNAIRWARTNGRGGKGCVVCFAAGNDNGPVSYPGTLPEVITVAACNEFGQAKTKTSSDGEGWWGSNFGPEVDVCAPGVHITTTDIAGARGYSTGNYVSTFNGTSAATPHVAGVAALVLSANAQLTGGDVEAILRSSTDDIGGAGWDARTGSGRIHAARAARAAMVRWDGPRMVPGWFGSQNQGGDVAVSDINRNGRPDLLVFHVDNPGGENHGYYRIGWNVDALGNVTGGWSPLKPVPGWFGAEDQGAGVALRDVNGNGSMDVIVYHIDNPGGANHGYYRIGWNLNAAGDVTGGWSAVKPIPGWFGSENQGGGIAVADLNGDGRPELIVFHIDNPGGENRGYYRIGWNLNAAGDVTGGWSAVKPIPGWFGSENQGGGVAVMDVNSDGRPELIVFHIDNPGGENHGYYRIGYNLNAAGDPTSWSGPRPIPGWFGSENQGGGIALAKLDADSRFDMILLHLDNPSGENHGYYRVGWNLTG